MADSNVLPTHQSRQVPFDLIPKVLRPGTLNLFGGASGVGKTAMLAEWLVRFRDGRTICRQPTRIPPGIGIVTCDRGWHSHQEWFDRVGFPDIPRYSIADDLSFNLDAFQNGALLFKVLETAILRLRLPPESLVVVDPIALFIAGTLLDYKSAALSLLKLGRICRQLQVTIIGSMHTCKQKGGTENTFLRPQDRILGSAALSGYTDTQLYLVGPEETETDYYELGWVPHNGPNDVFRFARDKKTGLFIPYAVSESERAQVQAYLCALITTELAGTKMEDIVQAAEDHLRITRRTVQRHLDDLITAGRVEKVGYARYRRIVPS